MRKCKYILLFLPLFFSSSIKADVSYEFYFVKGTISNINDEVVKNTYVTIQQGTFIRLVKTNDKGEFTVKMTYYIPCMSSRYSKSSDLNKMKDSEVFNGKKMLFFIEKSGEWCLAESSWKDFYSGNKTRKDTIFVDLKMENSRRANFGQIKEKKSKFLDDKAIIESYDDANNTYDKEYYKALERIIDYIELIGLTVKEFTEKTALIPKQVDEQMVAITSFKISDYPKTYQLILDDAGVIIDVNIKWGNKEK